MNKQGLKEIVEGQVNNENNAARLLRDSATKTNNVVVQLMLNQLALDSEKHAYMLGVILQLLDSNEQFQQENEQFLKIIQKHVEIEKKMLEDFERTVDLTEDRRLRFIIQDIIRDEKKHHAVVKRMYQLIFESETIQDEKWWDFLFRYSRLND